MERHGDQVELTKTEARAGETRHHVRYILLISLVLAIVVLSIAWMTGALSTRNAEPDSPIQNAAPPATAEQPEAPVIGAEPDAAEPAAASE